MKCSKCSTLLPDNAQFCPQCGIKIRQEFHCANGHPMQEGQKFCSECGAPLAELGTSIDLPSEKDISKTTLDKSLIRKKVPFTKTKQYTKFWLPLFQCFITVGSLFLILVVCQECENHYKNIKYEERKNNNPRDVRHLMELEGWKYCCKIFTDTYYKGDRETEPWIRENKEPYALYKKDRDFALVIPRNEDRPLSEYSKGHEMLSAKYWIKYYVVVGDYSVSAQLYTYSGRSDVKRRYNGKALTDGGAIYCNIPESFCH